MTYSKMAKELDKLSHETREAYRDWVEEELIDKIEYIATRLKDDLRSPEYSVNQPLSSFKERFTIGLFLDQIIELRPSKRTGEAS